MIEARTVKLCSGTVLKGYQYVGARMIHEFGGCALLADEMGLGKSLQALYYCQKRLHARPIVVVCPATLKWNWEREAAHHLNMASEVLHGRKPPRRQAFTKHAPVLIINYEILHSWADYLIALKPQVVVFDEAHFISNHESQRFKALKRVLVEGEVPHRIALSGTPLSNRPSELWAVLHLLRPDVFKSYVSFGFKYCQPRLMRGKWEFHGAKNLAKLHERLKKFLMIRRLKKDVASELPKKSRRVVSIDLSPADRKEYDFCRDNFLAWMRLRFPAKLHKAKKAPKLTQIGYLMRLAAKLIRYDIKDWIDNFLAESDDKLVVFSMHRKMIHWLAKQYEGTCVVIDGTVSGIKRHHAVDTFQKVKRCRLSFCHPKAAGVGITLTSAADVLYTDFPWAPGTLKQGEDRIHRIGQSKRCTIWLLVARRTITERLCQLLTDKQEILDQILDGIESGKDFDIFQELLHPTKGLLS